MYIILSLLMLFSLTFAENGNYECGYDSQWKSYRDEKCLRVIKTMATRDEAINACNEQNERIDSFSPSLLTIKSREEQNFMENYFFNELGIEDNVWIGGKRVNNSFVWNDGSHMEFSNWAKDKPTGDEGKNCIQMNSNVLSFGGQWIDSSCDRQGFIVCEKFQIWSFPDLQKAFLQSRRNFYENYDNLKNELRARDERIVTLEHNVQELNMELLSISSQIENFRSELLIAVNNSYQILFKDNENIWEQIRIKSTQIVAILQDIDHLKTNSSNPNNSLIENLRTELLAVINSKFNDFTAKTVTDIQITIVSYRRVLQMKMNGQWITIGYVN